MEPLIKIIIYLGLKDEQRFLRLLAKLEYGVSIFCNKLAQQASEERHFNLATSLEKHAQEEERHGKMLASLIDGNLRIRKTDKTGRWTKLIRLTTGENIAEPNPEKDCQIQKIVWDSYKYPGEKLEGYFESFDGLSRRYISLQLLLGGRKATDFDWSDRLAFMHCLEEGTREFYRVLSQEGKSEPLRAIVSQIMDDEASHSEYLRYALGHFTHFPDDEIKKWQRRLWWGMLGLLIDMWRFLV